MRAGLPLDRETILIEILGEMQSNAGICTRMNSNPPPMALGLHSTGFLQVWMLLVPLGFKTHGSVQNVIIEVICMAVIVLLMLGCDEVSTQLGKMS